MFDHPESFVTADGRTIGGVMMEMKNITLRFGGVVAIKDISFDAHAQSAPPDCRREIL